MRNVGIIICLKLGKSAPAFKWKGWDNTMPYFGWGNIEQPLSVLDKEMCQLTEHAPTHPDLVIN